MVRDFNVRDLSISHPENEETIGTGLLVVLSLVVPLIVILLIFVYCILRVTTFAARINCALDLHSALLGLLQSWICSSAVVDFMKVVTGELRPDFLARCVPDVTNTCTGDLDDILDGRKSFPSLHSSMCTAGLCYLSIYIAGKLRPYNGENDGYFWKMPLIVAPSILALYVGLTRVADNQHHPGDVFVGFVIGLAFAWGAYRLHYPSLYDSHTGTPLYIIKYKSEPDKEGGDINIVQKDV